jgi:hypothetical protein
MARRRPSTLTVATAPHPHGTASNDKTLYTHNLWLNYLKPVSLGLVFSANALRSAQIELPLQSAEAQKAFEELTILKPVTDDNDVSLENPPRILRSTREFLIHFLGWTPELLEFFRPVPRAQMFAGQATVRESSACDEPPDELRHELIQSDETLEPSFAYRWAQAPESGSRWCLLGLEIPPDVDLDRKPHDGDEATWVESPQKKFERLLYATRVSVGLIVQGTAVRLVYRPEEQQSGFITFPLDPLPKPAGRLACSALKAILNDDRLHRLPGRQRLHHILAESRKFQSEVSTQLAEQVLAALFELLKGFEAADEEARGRILRGLRNRPDRTHEIYEGLLTVLMRLVFLLYAEEREMFPSDPLFARNYFIAGLFARLVEDEARHPDTMDQR